MADVVPIQGHTEFERHEVRSALWVLRDSARARPSEVLVIGIGADGNLFVSGSPPDPEKAMWLMEYAKLRLLGVK